MSGRASGKKGMIDGPASVSIRIVATWKRLQPFLLHFQYFRGGLVFATFFVSLLEALLHGQDHSVPLSHVNLRSGCLFRLGDGSLIALRARWQPIPLLHALQILLQADI